MKAHNCIDNIYFSINPHHALTHQLEYWLWSTLQETKDAPLKPKTCQRTAEDTDMSGNKKNTK